MLDCVIAAGDDSVPQLESSLDKKDASFVGPLMSLFVACRFGNGDPFD